MNRTKLALLLLAVLSLQSRVLVAQDSPEVAAGKTPLSSPAYPNSSKGLKQLLEMIMQTARNGEDDKVAAYVQEMDIPNFESWFYKTYARDKAESWIGPYRENLKTNDKTMQQVLSSLARRKGKIAVRKVKHSPQPGHGLEWGMLDALKQPVDIYFASWESGSMSQPIGYFMFIEEKFRWDSLVQFAWPIRVVSSAECASAQSSTAMDVPIAEPVYKVGGGVSPPRTICNPDPEYSEAAKTAKREGKVVLWVVIGSDGLPHDIRIVRSLGDGLDEKAIEAVRKWRFEPARKDGQPVAVQVNVEVNFHL